MIPAAKMRAIAERLLTKTQADEVRWQPHDELEYACELRLPHASVELVAESPTGGQQRVKMILNKVGEVEVFPVGEWLVPEGDPDWKLANALFEAASRVAYSWDEVLEDVETAINAGGTIGITE
jgi:hypothetical protein